jgi:hypothetical protein
VNRYRSAEARVFGVATAVALLHAIDDAFVHRGPGLGVGQHALAGAISVVVAVAGIAVFPSLRPGLRAALAFSFGALACVNGMLHVLHIGEDGPAGGDVSGVLALAAGAVLIGLAASILWRRRGEATWRGRVVGVPAGLLLVVVVLGPVGLGITETHKWQRADRLTAERRVPRGLLPLVRRTAARRVVSAFAQRRGSARRARRWRRPDRGRRPRRDAGAPWLRRAGLRRPRAR